MYVYVGWSESECIHNPNVNGLTRDNVGGPVVTLVEFNQKIAAYIWKTIKERLARFNK